MQKQKALLLIVTPTQRNNHFSSNPNSLFFFFLSFPWNFHLCFPFHFNTFFFLFPFPQLLPYSMDNHNSWACFLLFFGYWVLSTFSHQEGIYMYIKIFSFFLSIFFFFWVISILFVSNSNLILSFSRLLELVLWWNYQLHWHIWYPMDSRQCLYKHRKHNFHRLYRGKQLLINCHGSVFPRFPRSKLLSNTS